MKIAIIGSRDFANYKLIEETVGKFVEGVPVDEKITVVSGGAVGADSLGEHFAIQNGFDVIIYKPDWKKHGKAAGHIRNTDIINSADVVFAFWNGESKGTLDSIEKAKKLSKQLYIIEY